MSKLMIAIAVAAGMVGMAGPAAGQSLSLPSPPPDHVAKSVSGWVAGGAGGGFGLGFLLGMRAFDQATYAERKILTSAVVGAVVGAAAGYLVGRSRRSQPRAPSLKDGFMVEQSALISERLAAQLAKSVTFASRPVVKPASGIPRWTPAQGWAFAVRKSG